MQRGVKSQALEEFVTSKGSYQNEAFENEHLACTFFFHVTIFQKSVLDTTPAVATTLNLDLDGANQVYLQKKPPMLQQQNHKVS